MVNMKKIKPESVIEGIIVLFLILFVYASFSKLFKLQDFANQIGVSPILKPISAIKYVTAITVPAIEIMAATLLIFPTTRLTGFWLSLIIMTLFTIYIIAILTIASYVPCSCGGVLEQLSWTQHLILNIGFILLAVLGIFMIKRKTKDQEVSGVSILTN
jgi:uncharacterized membrane protein YphA (DoxX/SURF4 family)